LKPASNTFPDVFRRALRRCAVPIEKSDAPAPLRQQTCSGGANSSATSGYQSASARN
jgi:hypothetical protein